MKSKKVGDVREEKVRKEKVRKVRKKTTKRETRCFLLSNLGEIRYRSDWLRSSSVQGPLIEPQ